MRLWFVLGFFSLVPATHAAVLISEGQFLDNLSDTHFTNGFDQVTTGESPTLNFDESGYSYSVSSNPSLYNGDGFVSTNTSNTAIQVVFDGASVTAVGGNFWATDIDLMPIEATITLALSNGVSESFLSTSPEDYRGFTSNVSIQYLHINVSPTLTFDAAWASLDNLTVGVIPEPSSASSIVCIALFLLTRARQSILA